MSPIIQIAEKEIGYTESPANTNQTKYGVWFGYNGVAWCAIFISWCYAKAGTPLEAIGFKKGFAGCQTAVAYYKKTGQVTTSPVPGDLVFFDWNGDGRYDHVGIFKESLSSQSFQTIEGNTSVKNQSNGGTVMQRSRGYFNVLFVHPKTMKRS